MKKPLCVDLCCGLGGWTQGFLAEGYDAIGFDIEHHRYGEKRYPAQLVLQDITTLHGSQFRDAACIVGSSPCQEFSYRAMPWKRAKELPPPYKGIELFEAQFRIQREASAAAGRWIPMVAENVVGAQKWVGRAAWHYGSYYLWGDVPALMPAARIFKTVGHVNIRDGYSHTRHLTNQRESDAVKQHGSGAIWFDEGIAHLPSHSPRRKSSLRHDRRDSVRPGAVDREVLPPGAGQRRFRRRFAGAVFPWLSRAGRGACWWNFPPKKNGDLAPAPDPQFDGQQNSIAGSSALRLP